MAGRIAGIDVLKVFAVFFVLNSHMGACYGEYAVLATGGAIGDALFFFCSGFTLLLGAQRDFLNWYKRRIARIYPSVLVVGVLACALWGARDDIVDVVTFEKYWFLRCIFFYYLLIFPIKKYFLNRLKTVFGVCAAALAAIYLCFCAREQSGLIYGGGAFREMMYFLFMLAGAIVGRDAGRERVWRLWHLPALIFSVGAWYGIVALWGGSVWHVLSVVPLLGVAYFLYSLASSPFFARCYETPVLGNLLFVAGSLCLEVYLVQRYLFTTALNAWFPLNIPIVMAFVFAVAYGVKALSEFLSQTFDSKPYELKKLLLRK